MSKMNATCLYQMAHQIIYLCLAMVSWKFGHCSLLHNYLDLWCSYYQLSFIFVLKEYKCSIWQLYFGTLVFALYCYCGDNVKYGLVSKKTTIWRLKKSQSNEKLLEKRTSWFSYSFWKDLSREYLVVSKFSKF